MAVCATAAWRRARLADAGRAMFRGWFEAGTCLAGPGLGLGLVRRRDDGIVDFDSW